MNKKIETGYIPELDRTVIFENTFKDNQFHDIASTKIIGWYFGEPNEEDTKIFGDGSIEAIFEF